MAEISDSEVKEILQRLTRIETRLDDMPVPQCAINGQRLDILEKDCDALSATVGKQNFVAAIISALVAGVAMSAKWMVSK